MNFHIGDQVLCINDAHHQLVKGKIYTVEGLSECQHCQALVLDVGLRLNLEAPYHFCRNCKSRSEYKDPLIHFAYATRFVKIDDLSKEFRWSLEERKNAKTMREKFNAGRITFFEEEEKARSLEDIDKN